MKKTISFLLSIIILVSLIFVPNVSALAASGYTVTVKNGEYIQLYNVGAGLYLNISGNKSANNTNINVYQDDGTSGYWFKPGEKNGKYYFVPKCATSSAVNVYGNSAKDGANVCVWKLSKSSTQLWVIEYNEKHKGFVLRCADDTSLVLTACGSSNGSNVCVKKYDSSNKHQIWTSNAFSAKKIETTKYKVSFDGNGGKAAKSSETAAVNTTITLPSATRSGYTFLGWSTSKSAKTAAYKSSAAYKVTKKITLYAVWQKNDTKKYTVTFNGNGGTAVEKSKAAGKNTSITLPSATRSGYTFLGWSTSKSAKTATYKSGDSYKVTKNVTLYAVWEEIKMVSPVNNRKLTSPFQPYYRHDFTSNYGHGGVDYVSSNNDKRIMVFFDGKVTQVITKAQNKSTGNLIEIKHIYKGKTFYSYYWHLADGSIKVKVGDTVKAGIVIATMGKTGTATGVHLHFQITDKSCINSDKSVHVPKRDSSKKNMTKAEQAKMETFSSLRGITFYNPNIVLQKGIEVIVGS